MSLKTVVLALALAMVCANHQAISAQIPLIECSQSSTIIDAPCIRAIDGNTNQNFHDNSCTHTDSQRSWWQARTARVTHFTQIRIYNRADCCPERLNDFTITIDGHPSVIYRSSESFSVNTFHLDRVGQVVRITSNKDAPLTLCEVQVFGTPVDLPAPGEQLPLTECQQSSTTESATCGRAIDGNRDQNFHVGSCTHTAEEKSWWQAYTRKAARVSHVRVYNRLDCCSERLSDITISIDGFECSSYSSTEFFSVRTFKCDAEGQVVRISSNIVTHLTLCEVEVFGEEITSPPLGEQLTLTDCQQSSTEADGACQRAIDGVTNQYYEAKSCSHTASEVGWWRAETRQLSHFTHIRIFNRLDCCSERLNDFAIFVDGFACASHVSTKPFEVMTFECNREGQVLLIANRKNSPLTLCEVQAFGQKVQLREPGPKLQLSQCVQSSTEADGSCERAIDGKVSQLYGDGTCTHTKSEMGWWQARTNKPAKVTHVRIYNRLDCCSDRLGDFAVLVDGRECASYQSGGFFSVHTFQCDAVGQLVRIINRKSSPLTLCEVQVFGQEVEEPKLGDRITLTACSQSSVTADGVCHRAIDGNTNQDYGGGSCTHTNGERGWWQGQLAKMSQVTHVRIYNRMDCCSERLSDFAISIDGHECASYRSEANAFFSVETFKCEGVGQAIRISNRIPTPLSLCEVHVFGSSMDLVAPAKQLRLSDCSQSSTDAHGDCQRAIDGIRNQDYGAASCSHTGNHKGWWQARLAKTSFVTQVRIYNRLDCCSDRLNDFTISVGGHECASYQSDGYFSMRTFECHEFGQIVRIESHKVAPLTLCEVEVFGTDQPK